MTIEQAIEELKMLDQESSSWGQRYNKLCSFLQSQQDEIERLQNKYERVCPICGDNPAMNGCKTCKGTERIPRVILPDKVAMALIEWIRIENCTEYVPYESFIFEDKNSDVVIKAAKLPDSDPVMWELESTE